MSKSPTPSTQTTETQVFAENIKETAKDILVMEREKQELNEEIETLKKIPKKDRTASQQGRRKDLKKEIQELDREIKDSTKQNEKSYKEIDKKLKGASPERRSEITEKITKGLTTHEVKPTAPSVDDIDEAFVNNLYKEWYKKENNELMMNPTLQLDSRFEIPLKDDIDIQGDPQQYFTRRIVDDNYPDDLYEVNLLKNELEGLRQLRTETKMAFDERMMEEKQLLQDVSAEEEMTRRRLQQLKQEEQEVKRMIMKSKQQGMNQIKEINQEIRETNKMIPTEGESMETETTPIRSQKIGNISKFGVPNQPWIPDSYLAEYKETRPAQRQETNQYVSASQRPPINVDELAEELANAPTSLMEQGTSTQRMREIDNINQLTNAMEQTDTTISGRRNINNRTRVSFPMNPILKEGRVFPKQNESFEDSRLVTPREYLRIKSIRPRTLHEIEKDIAVRDYERQWRRTDPDDRTRLQVPRSYLRLKPTAGKKLPENRLTQQEVLAVMPAITANTNLTVWLAELLEILPHSEFGTFGFNDRVIINSIITRLYKTKGKSELMKKAAQYLEVLKDAETTTWERIFTSMAIMFPTTPVNKQKVIHEIVREFEWTKSPGLPLYTALGKLQIPTDMPIENEAISNQLYTELARKIPSEITIQWIGYEQMTWDDLIPIIQKKWNLMSNFNNIPERRQRRPTYATILEDKPKQMVNYTATSGKNNCKQAPKWVNENPYAGLGLEFSGKCIDERCYTCQTVGHFSSECPAQYLLNLEKKRISNRDGKWAYELKDFPPKPEKQEKLEELWEKPLLKGQNKQGKAILTVQMMDEYLKTQGSPGLCGRKALIGKYISPRKGQPGYGPRRIDQRSPPTAKVTGRSKNYRGSSSR